MSTSGPDDTPPPSELQGLDPKDLLQAGLETVPPVTLPPQPVDSDVTIPVARPQSTQPAPQVELPLPEELTNLLPGGNYHVESFLGQGGMGAVYKGMQVRLKRPVAIKIMRRDMGKDYDFEARFEREAQAMAKLNHPNIVSVIDFGEAGADYLYIVMELIDGADLMDVIRGGQMTQEMALTLLPQVCDALQFAHDHGIVHRDIKPSNIMLTRDGRVKMCDFGLAKRYDVESSFRTQTGTGMGTPDYAAPEQFDPKANIDHRADIYALGVMIYQMITGQLPRGVWKPPSQRAAVQPEWDDIVSRAMQSDPSDRYQHASEVKTDVSSIALVGRSTDIPVRAPSNPPPSGASQGTDKKVRSTSRAPLLLGLVAGAVVIALVAFFALNGPDESGRGRQTATEAPPDRALASTPTSTFTSPGLPDLPPLSVPSGEPRLVKEFPVSRNMVRGMHLLPDSRRLLIVQDDVLTLHDLETEKQAWFIKGGKGAVSSAINGDGTRFVVAYPFDAAGKALVAPGPNGGHFEVNLHEMGTGNVMQSWKVPYKSMSNATDQIALSPSGNTLVVRTGGYGTEGTTFVALELGKSEPVAQWTPAGHHGYTTHALSETRFISTGSVPPFQMNTAAPAAKLEEPKWLAEAKYGSVFSPDRRWVVASNGSSCSVWDMATGKSHLLENSETIFSFGGFAGNDLLLRNRSNTETPKRIIQVWDRATGHLLADYPPSKPGFYWGPLSAGAPNGQFFVNVVAPLATAPNKSDRILQVWSLPKPGQVHGLVKPPTSQPESPSPASSPTVSIPGLPDLPPLAIPPGEPGLVKEFLVSGNYLRNSHVLPDSRRMLSFPDGTAVLIDLETTRPIWSQPTERGFFAKAINRDGSRFATYHLFNEKGVGLGTQTGATEARICLHETATGKLLQIWKTLTDGKDVNYDFIGLTPSGTRIIARVRGGEATFSTFLLFEEGKPDPVERWEAPPGHYGYNTYAWKEDAFISTSPTGALLMLPGGKMEPLVTELPQYHSDLSPAGNWLVATNNSKLGLWDLAARKFTHNLEHSTTSGRVISFAGEDLVLMAEKPSVAGLCRTLQCWDRKTGILIAKLPVTRPDEYFDNVIGAPNGTFAVLRLKHDPAPVGGEKNLLQIWRLPKPGQVRSSAAALPSGPNAVSSPSTATKDAPFINTLGMKFVPVPITGGPTDKQRVLFSVWETRVHDYEVFVKETKRKWNKSGLEQGTTHPAVNMNCEDAMAFCAWLTETEHKAGKLDAQLAYRLPSDHEWSCAVGIGDKEDAAKTPGEKNILIPVFPWGNQWPPPADAGNYGGLELKPLIDSGRLKGERTDLGEWQDSFVQTAPCGSFRESRGGLFDLGGNAFEWCNTPWSAHSTGAVIRGASTHDGQRERLFSSLRVEKSLNTTSDNLGFRIVLAPQP